MIISTIIKIKNKQKKEKLGKTKKYKQEQN